MSNLLSRSDPLARALGYVNWRANPLFFTAAAAPASKEVQVASIWLPFGVPINNIALQVSVAAAGTANTGVWVGIGNRTKQLAQSANLNTGAGLTSLQTLGIQKFALNAPFTPEPTDSADGLFYVTLLVDNTVAWSVTPPQFTRLGLGAAPAAGIGFSAGRAGTAQSAFSANGNAYAATIGVGGGQEWWAACLP